MGKMEKSKYSSGSGQVMKNGKKGNSAKGSTEQGGMGANPPNTLIKETFGVSGSHRKARQERGGV